MAQNIIDKVEQKQPLTIQEEEFINTVKQNPSHSDFKDLWLAGLV